MFLSSVRNEIPRTCLVIQFDDSRKLFYMSNSLFRKLLLPGRLYYFHNHTRGIKCTRNYNRGSAFVGVVTVCDPHDM